MMRCASVLVADARERADSSLITSSWGHDTVSKMINRTKEQVLADLDQGTWLKGSLHTEDTATARYSSHRISPA